MRIKTEKKHVIIFVSIIILCLIYCFCIIPSYILEKLLMYNDAPWSLYEAIFTESIIKNLYLWLRYKIPDETILPVILM